MKRYLKTSEEVIDALQDGKEIHDSDGRVWKLYKGCVIRKDKSGFWSINTPIDANYDELYVYETEPLKLEVGKFYKTRNGRKAFVYAKTDSEPYHCWAVIIDSSDVGTFCCTANGVYTVDKESEKDLVAPWEE